MPERAPCHPSACGDPAPASKFHEFVRKASIVRRQHAEGDANIPPVVLADALPDAHVVHVAGEVAVRLRLKMRLDVAHLPRTERTEIPPPLVLYGVQRF